MPPRVTRVLRVARVVGGTALLVAGAALLVLPGPGIPMVLGGLILVGTEFEWARRLRARVTGAAGRLGPSLRRASTWLLGRVAYGLALLPMFTDWVDTGHWPHHPREFATEIIVGVVIFLGVWRLHRRAEHFRSLSETDPLTRLRNRARFRADLEAAVARARAEGSIIAVGIVDVDRFKDINDRFGHAAGDDALREVAVALDRSVRQGVDGCYRLGGDEFAVLVAGAGSQHLLDALRRGFDRASRVLAGPISCSIGVVTRRDGEGADELVHRADHFMYAAKGGRAGEGNDAHSFGRLKLGTPGERRQPGRASGILNVASTVVANG